MQSSSNVTKVIGFWVLFGALFYGMQHVSLPGLGRAGAAVAGLFVTALMLIILSRLVDTDGESFTDIGLGVDLTGAKQFLVGTGLGLAVVAVMIGVVKLFTPLEIQVAADANILAVLAASFLILFALALMEEVAFRSYALFKLQQAWGIRPAVYITSVAFAFYHGFVFESLLGPGVWGLLYAWMALKTKSIALPTGFHLGLNWMQALLGMKPQYSDSIWDLSIGTHTTVSDVETVGLIMQLVLLVVGVVLVERFIVKQRASS